MKKEKTPKEKTEKKEKKEKREKKDKEQVKAERAEKRAAKKELRMQSREEHREERREAKKNRPKRFRFDKRFPFIHLQKMKTAAVRHFITVSGAEEDEARRRLITNISAAFVIGSALAVILTLSDISILIPFVIPGMIIFCLYTIFAGNLNRSVKLIIAGAIFLLLATLLLVLWKYIRDGSILIIDEIFTISEQSQAYVYDRYQTGNTGYNSPDLCMYIASMWLSSVICFFAALLPFRCRRAVSVVFFITAAAVTAYYGIVPNWICTGVLAISLLISLCNGRIAPSWPLILMAVIMLGALVLIDPADTDFVSRANEKVRDRFAYQTAYLVNYDPYDSMYDDGNNEEFQEDPETEEEPAESKSKISKIGKKGWLIITLCIVALALAIAIIILFIRLSRRRYANREGIDSEDPVTAVAAMFPYAMRWLRLCGIRISNVPYSDLVPQIEDRLPGSYVTKFEEMHDLWSQAAFSDHKITFKDREHMNDFLEETIEMANERLKFKDKFKVWFKYAL